jgi:hypothetical protein
MSDCTSDSSPSAVILPHTQKVNAKNREWQDLCQDIQYVQQDFYCACSFHIQAATRATDATDALRRTMHIPSTHEQGDEDSQLHPFVPKPGLTSNIESEPNCHCLYRCEPSCWFPQRKSAPGQNMLVKGGFQTLVHPNPHKSGNWSNHLCSACHTRLLVLVHILPASPSFTYALGRLCSKAREQK